MSPYEYLSQRVGKVVLDSDKLFNHGCYLLANYPEWESLLETIIDESWDTLLRYCIRNKNVKHTASVKLTFASDLIGKRLAKLIEQDTQNIKTTLALGDLMLETFLQDKLIEIYREYDGIKAPYMVRIKNQPDGVKPTLLGTTFEMPLPISGLMSPITNEPFIKGWNNKDTFAQYLDQPFIKALNKLRSTAWSINKDVLYVLENNPPATTLSLVDKQGEIKEFHINGQNRYSKGMTHLDGTPFLGKGDPKLQRLISKHFEYTQVLNKAKLVSGIDKPFYQEVSCDYRGRVYYSESFLEFQGSDMARSLFMFDEKKAVDESGFKWMLIHAANSYNESFTIDQLKQLDYLEIDYIKHLKSEGLDTISLDKMTLKDREQWARENFQLITDTGKHKSYLDNAEKPYAFLAVCIDILGYVNASIKGEEYLSGLPIPLDGSNNGWQHLAAMSRDKQAGELVSLTPTPIQKDFYVAVAKDLIRLMPEWFEDRGIPMKHIRKGISKRGSMTRAYSAGKTRIAKNMYDDCHVEGFTTKYNITEKDCNKLADNLIKAINQVCAGPLRTTKYLQKIAEHELNNGRNTLDWVTPSGFPVVYKSFLQHERKQRGTIKGIEGNKDGRVTHVVRVDVLTKDTNEKVPCRRSFASGISPNFVHSMDAAHMANTINAFTGSFAAVHDSFSSHASDIDWLQEVTKMTFIAQYDIENFFDKILDMLMLNKDTFETDQPMIGNLDVTAIKDSDYFFC